MDAGLDLLIACFLQSFLFMLGIYRNALARRFSGRDPAKDARQITKLKKTIKNLEAERVSMSAGETTDQHHTRARERLSEAKPSKGRFLCLTPRRIERRQVSAAILHVFVHHEVLLRIELLE